jgi:hypothetical protein
VKSPDPPAGEIKIAPSFLLQRDEFVTEDVTVIEQLQLASLATVNGRSTRLVCPNTVSLQIAMRVSKNAKRNRYFGLKRRGYLV